MPNKRQAITRIDVDQNEWHYMSSLGHNELAEQRLPQLHRIKHWYNNEVGTHAVCKKINILQSNFREKWPIYLSSV